jgi:hypothetical protein
MMCARLLRNESAAAEGRLARELRGGVERAIAAYALAALGAARQWPPRWLSLFVWR